MRTAYLEKENKRMNKVILIGRLTKDTEVRYAGETAIARYTLAVDRKFKKDGEQEADFINCVAFGKSGEFAEKYFKKGMKVAITGRIQTGSYSAKDTGKTVYTTDIVVEEQEFCERKEQGTPKPSTNNGDEFMSIPDSLDEELPFN
jgi:single-strand DNA-binding protein